MLGAIIGDIVGSRYELNNHRSKEFELFTDGCFTTDASIMTIAVAKAILETAKAIEPTVAYRTGFDADYCQMLNKMTVKYLQEIGRKYPNCGYDGLFRKWLFNEHPQPYNSFGNGAAMRISPAGFVVGTESEVFMLTETITAVTHNHDEGIKGAEAVALAVFMARQGYSKNEIRQKITGYYYPLDFTIDQIRSSYQFKTICQETVPQAIACFLEATSFEDAIRTAISLGGDSDTIGAITGAIAQAYYGVPQDIKEKALSYLDAELRAIYDEWVAFAPPCDEQFMIGMEDDGVSNVQMNDQQFFVIKDFTGIDVLDENLYSYDSGVFGLTPAMQTRTSEGLLGKVERFIDSVPAAQKARDYLQNKTEYMPRLDLLPEEIKQALQNGTAEMIPCKEANDAFFLQIRTTVKDLVINGKKYGKHRKIKDIPLGTKTVPADVTGAMRCLSMQKQLNQITDGLKELSEVCELNFTRIIQGQRDDRLAKLLSSRSCSVQAISMADEFLQRQMLIQAVCDANAARAELGLQIRSDILLLEGKNKLKTNEMEKTVYDINTAMVAMNNAVHISLYSYQVLGERNAQLAVVKEHETFLKQVLLREINYNGTKKLAWELICSSGNSKNAPQHFELLPRKLLDSCDTFIKNANKNSTNYLEDK